MGISTRLVSLAAILTLSGCVLPDKFLIKSDYPTAPIQQIATTWNPKVAFVPDPTRNGEPAPGISGRMYMFSAEGLPVAGDGAIVFDLYDDTNVAQKPGGTHIEQWRFDPVTLRRLITKDTYGCGYTIFLPWGTYKQDIKTVHITVRYEPAQGGPLYAPSGPLTIDHGLPPVVNNNPMPSVPPLELITHKPK